MNLRAATIDDVESLFDIRCSILENHQSRDELASLGIAVESVSEMIEGGDYIVTLAEVKGRPVGFTMAQISEAYIFAERRKNSIRTSGPYHVAPLGRLFRRR